MKKCPKCGYEQSDSEFSCINCHTKFSEVESSKEEESEVGKMGFGIDSTCGSIEPTIKLGNGIGIGMDGHITFGGF